MQTAVSQLPPTISEDETIQVTYLLVDLDVVVFFIELFRFKYWWRISAYPQASIAIEQSHPSLYNRQGCTLG